jgi:hypothetical protein
MTQSKGIDWKHVTFVMGTRADLAPPPLPQPVYQRNCENCGSITYTETEYPLDVPMLCNVCAATVTAESESDSDTLLLFDMPNDLKARLIDLAYQKRIPVEAVFKDFMEWKLERRTKASLYNKSLKKEEKK